MISAEFMREEIGHIINRNASDEEFLRSVLAWTLFVVGASDGATNTAVQMDMTQRPHQG